MIKRRLPITSYVGLSILLSSGVLLFLRIWPVTLFFTPLAWTGYILFVDGIVFVCRGDSLLVNRTGELLLMIPLSVVCWLVFEAYNIHIRNWHYEGLPQSLWIRWLGYGWSFATIFPGIFETTELLECFGIFRRIPKKRRKVSRTILYFFILTGTLCLILPILLPWTTARYLAILIWVGFIFLLDPINYRLQIRSLLRNWEEGQMTKLFSLMLAGLICGFLWELWNFWAEARWVYDVPIAQNMKIFEMVLPGYLGFIPFAVECYVMYIFGMRILFNIRLE